MKVSLKASSRKDRIAAKTRKNRWMARKTARSPRGDVSHAWAFAGRILSRNRVRAAKNESVEMVESFSCGAGRCGAVCGE